VTEVEPGAILWEAGPERIAASGLGHYLAWLRDERGLALDDHPSLWRWSVTDLEGFWASIWDYFSVGPPLGATRPLGTERMPGASWFPGTELNYAAHALADRGDDDAESLVAVSESRPTQRLTRGELRDEVARVAAGLRELGVTRGDVVAGYLPHGVEAVVAFLATASIGAVWTICPPDYGVAGVRARFSQVSPKVLIGIDGYRYRGREHPRVDMLMELGAAVGATATIVVNHLGHGPDARLLEWDQLGSPAAPLHFEPVAFDHPLWVLYSSGTTGVPKAIVHGHGGILLEHLKALNLQHDVRAGDRMLWYTSTGWMMWNLSIGGLLLGATVIAFDGDPRGEHGQALWRLVEEERVTRMSIGAPLITTLAAEGFQPAYDTSSLGCLGATGAPLSPAASAWVYRELKADLMLAVGSGGTDVCSAFVGPSVLLPVRAGRLAGRCLGVAVEAFDADGRPLTGTPGELVVTRPMPSMPLFFWGDDDGERFRSSYFDVYPGIWRHGDRIEFDVDGSCVILGRSDATLNRGGVRLGTADLYSVFDSVEGVADSLVVHLDEERDRLVALVVLVEGHDIDDLRAAIVRRLAGELSPRHVPDDIIEVRALPRTLSGKRLEVPVKRILAGAPVAQVVDPSTVTDAAALSELSEIGRTLAR
jgi:acetoacetyl-CoA synthetase